jgi:CO/xanthine dehydrogenase Mo-binding subunit
MASNNRFGIGQPVRRVEDVRFVTGSGRYLDDMSLTSSTATSSCRRTPMRGSGTSARAQRKRHRASCWC